MPLPADEVVPRTLRVAAAWGWRLIVLTIVAYGIWKVLAQIPVLVFATLVALLLTVLLGPVVTWLRRRTRWPRGLWSLLTVGLTAVLAAGVLALAGRWIAAGVSRTHVDFTGAMGRLENWLTHGRLHLRPEQIDSVITQVETWVAQHTSNLTQGAFQVGSSALDTIMGAILCLVTTIFLLTDGRRIWIFLIAPFPLASRIRIDAGFRSGWRSLSAYIHTQLLVAALDAVMVGTGAAILGSAFALPMAVLVFITAFVPIIGVVVGGGISILAMLLLQGWVAGLVMLAIVAGVQQLESHVMQPFLMGRAVSLHPLAVIFAVTAGSMMFGAAGALFAVPALAVANAGIRTYIRTPLRRPLRPVALTYPHEPPRTDG
ncbi:Predicted PurR-regulated permease PerM [Raineyella antarctica]|uniref:Predicted PurR-regulated permease PerM n=1 Tax=Raineyella antarctica TaxID=1577474 RepID=A0A1G6GCW8_9ACTN|nr:Predicted PurR-regulated permease PerM [Raineyella antarctica]